MSAPPPAGLRCQLTGPTEMPPGTVRARVTGPLSGVLLLEQLLTTSALVQSAAAARKTLAFVRIMFEFLPMDGVVDPCGRRGTNQSPSQRLSAMPKTHNSFDPGDLPMVSILLLRTAVFENRTPPSRTDGLHPDRPGLGRPVKASLSLSEFSGITVESKALHEEQFGQVGRGPNLAGQLLRRGGKRAASPRHDSPNGGSLHEDEESTGRHSTHSAGSRRRNSGSPAELEGL